MKKIITLLLVMTGMVNVNAEDNIYLRSNFNGTDYWDADVDGLKFTYVETNDKNEDVYTYTINASDIKETDVWFRIHISGWGAQICPYTEKGSYTYGFSDNGQNETYGAKYERTYFQGSTYSFGIEHSKIKASQYKISLYRGNDNVEYQNENCKVMWIRVDIVSMPVSVSEAGYATFSCDRALDFSNVSNVYAYIASNWDNNDVTLTKVSTIPASQGLFLRSADGKAAPVDVPVITSEAAGDAATNYLKACTTGETVKTTESSMCYVFAKQGDDYGFYKVSTTGVEVPAGKAYLEISNGGSVKSRLGFNFGDNEASGISSVKSVNSSSVYYDLQGRRVAQPAKGLYIVNGKKVMFN